MLNKKKTIVITPKSVNSILDIFLKNQNIEKFSCLLSELKQKQNN